MHSHALTDTFQRSHNYLRISLTEKCNLRCVYCMPEHGIPVHQLTPRNDLLSLDERKQLLRVFAQLGITKLRFTGGEPTISNQLHELIHYSKSLNINFIGITTNGLLLKQQLDDLTKAGLTSVNISMDSLQPQRFASITRRDESNLNRVLSAMYTAVAKGLHVKVSYNLLNRY